MKNLMKLAMGAAIAGALVSVLMKQRSGWSDEMDTGMDSGTRDDDTVRTGTSGFTVEEMVADTNTVGREESAQGQQPQDWRGAQNVLE